MLSSPKVHTPLLLILILSIALAVQVLPVQAAEGGPFTVFLPRVVSAGSGRVLAPVVPSCQLSSQEQALARFMADDPGQRRASLTCDPILAQVAREKAEDMAERGYFGHVNPDGLGPNYLVEQAGYDLPIYYEQQPEANNIESLAADYSGAAFVWAALVESDSHRPHVLGEGDFLEQTDYGIGYAHDPAAPYDYYWVILTATH